MLAALVPGCWVGGKDSKPTTRVVLNALERRGLCVRAIDANGCTVWRLTPAGECYNKALLPTKPRYEPKLRGD